jgi:hypothetical protein
MGRPRLNCEARELIVTIAADNPHFVSARSIRRYRRRGPARPPSQSWRTLLANHAQAIWAADLVVVQTPGFQTLYVLFLIGHDRRRPRLGSGTMDGTPMTPCCVNVAWSACSVEPVVPGGPKPAAAPGAETRMACVLPPVTPLRMARPGGRPGDGGHEGDPPPAPRQTPPPN